MLTARRPFLIPANCRNLGTRSLALEGGGFTPADMSALLFWLRSDKGITTATGVSVWADQSGNGNDAVQAASLSQPAYNATHAGFGGQPSVQPDGAQTVNGNWLDMTGLTSTAKSYTFFFVIDAVVASQSGMLLDAQTGRLFMFHKGNSGPLTRNDSYFDGNYQGGPEITTMTPVIIIYRFAAGGGSVPRVWLNGAAHSSDTFAADRNIGGAVHLFRQYNTTASFIGAHFGQIVCYERALTDAEVNTVQAYLSDWSGITATDI